MSESATHGVTFARFDDAGTYTLGVYTQRVAEKIAVALARRVDVRMVTVDVVWGKR